jgi:hypothetical protein
MDATKNEDVNVDKNIYGVAVKGKLTEINWTEVRQKIREKTTSIGEKVITLLGTRNVMGTYTLPT